MQDLFQFQGKAWSGIRIDVPEHAPMFLMERLHLFERKTCGCPLSCECVLVASLVMKCGCPHVLLQLV